MCITTLYIRYRLSYVFEYISAVVFYVQFIAIELIFIINFILFVKTLDKEYEYEYDDMVVGTGRSILISRSTL